MAIVAAPYGFRPTNMQGGQYDTHGMRLIKITPAYGTAIFNGDLVKINAATGTLEKEILTTGTKPVGVFMGCEYEDASLGLFHRNFWPAATVIKPGTNAWGYVIDDPDVLFELQANGIVDQTKLGLNANLVQTAGNTVTGRSAVAAATAGIANTATFPVRIVDFVRRPGSAVGDAFTDLIVRLNTHLNRDLTGAI